MLASGRFAYAYAAYAYAYTHTHTRTHTGALNLGQPDNSVKCADPNYDTRRDGNPPRKGLCSAWSSGMDARFKFNCPSWPSSYDDGDGCDGIPLAPGLAGLPDVKLQYLRACRGTSPPDGCGHSVTFPGLALTGPYEQVLHALHNVTYSPLDDQVPMYVYVCIYTYAFDQVPVYVYVCIHMRIHIQMHIHFQPS